MKTNKKGFTLIELLAVMIILSVLLTLAISGISKYVGRGKKEYYNGLETTVLAAGRDYFLDYRSLLPREIGNTSVVTSEELIKNGYIDEILDEDKKACTATITAEKVDKQEYKYYVCLQCSDHYASDVKNCELVGSNQQAKNFDINLNANLVQEINQCDDISIPTASVYETIGNETKLITNTLFANPKSIDSRVLGETSVKWIYRYKNITKTVRVVDRVSPTKPVVELYYLNGQPYKARNTDNSINIVRNNLVMVVNSRDYACPSKYADLDGSGLKKISYHNVGKENWKDIETNKTSTKATISGTLFGDAELKTVDKYENASELTSFEIYVDTVPPTDTKVEYLGGSNSHSWKNNYKLKLSATDGVAVKYFEIDYNGDGEPETTTGEIFIPPNGFSYCNVRFRAVDIAGNRGSWTKEKHHIHMDTEAPSKVNVDLGSYTSGVWTNTNVTAKYSATDSLSGVAYYEYSYDKKSIVGNVSSAVSKVIHNADGHFTFYVRAVDYASNKGNWSDAYVIRSDTVKPTVTVSVNKKQATFLITDNVAVNRYGVNNSSSSTPEWITIDSLASQSILWEASSPGNYNVWVRDLAGNINSTAYTISPDAFCSISINRVFDFSYTGNVQNFTAPCKGIYKLEVWGAQGGGTNGGQGGYSSGTIELQKNQTIYLQVGGRGEAGTSAERCNDRKCSGTGLGGAGGWNGGGAGSDINDNGWYEWNRLFGGYGGGGASSITITNRGELKNYDSYRSEVLIVAGGGGGSATTGNTQDPGTPGGAGGGLEAANGYAFMFVNNFYDNDYSKGTCGHGGNIVPKAGSQNDGYLFGLGQKGNATQLVDGTADGQGGSGGGWYGGRSATCGWHENIDAGGSGGSGYIEGVSLGITTVGGNLGAGRARITYIQSTF